MTDHADVRGLVLFRALLVTAVVCAFWVPASAGTGGAFPAPLDDVYIYFDFARSTARGCVLCWSPDGGYSSGATSPLYALVLAAGYALGARGMVIGWFAAAVGALCLFDLTGSIARLLAPRPWVAALGALLLLGVPLLDWTLVSGMEAAFVGCILGRALCATDHACSSAPHRRDRAQLAAGAWLALLALGRPECVPLALLLALAIAHASGTRPLARSAARALLPSLLVLGLFGGLNLALTGELAAAGAIRKGITSDPYASPNDVALQVAVHAVRTFTEGFDVALGGSWATRGLFLLALASLTSRRTRRLGAALCVGAAAAFVIMTLNKTAPFQNLRYLAPVYLMLLTAASLGLHALASRGPWFGALGAVIAGLLLASAARGFPRQTEHYARASRNIAEQQVEVGRRLAEMSPRPRRVFIGDAGAIPYVSDLPSLDGLGLGGHRDMPFARASVHGTASVVELIERMPANERPDTLAIYDSWWPDLGRHFGHKEFSVRIADNVICGDPEKTVYRADWGLLEDRTELAQGALMRLDVGDLVDERAFAVEFSQPRGGYVVAAVLANDSGALRFDALRILAHGQSLGFQLPAAASGRIRLELTTDSTPGTSFLVERSGGESLVVELAERASGSWGRATTVIEGVTSGERLRFVAQGGGLRIGSLRVLSEP